MSEDLRFNDRNPAEVVLNVPRTCRRLKKFAHNRIARSFNYHTVATCPTPSISNLEIPDRSHFISETKKAAARFRMIFFPFFFFNTMFALTCDMQKKKLKANSPPRLATKRQRNRIELQNYDKNKASEKIKQALQRNSPT